MDMNVDSPPPITNTQESTSQNNSDDRIQSTRALKTRPASQKLLFDENGQSTPVTCTRKTDSTPIPACQKALHGKASG